MKRCITLLFSLVMLAFLGACGPATALNSDVLVPTPTPVPPNEINIYSWETYIDPQILTDFEQEFGVRVVYQTFSIEQDAFDALQNGQPYDIVVLSESGIRRMNDRRLLALLNKENLPNLVNLDPDFLNPYHDPGNRHCVPYLWGTVGIGYNTARVNRVLNGWADLLAPATRARFTMLDDPRTSLGLALIYLGYSPNTTNPAEIRAARDFLLAQKNRIIGYSGDEGQDQLLEGSVDIVFEWSGDIFQLQAENPNIRYVIPEEGSVIWVDNVCIPVTARNPKMAETFINYLLRPDVAAKLANFTHYASPNQAARDLIIPADLKNPSIYPPDSLRRRLFTLVNLPPETLALYQQAWAEVLEAYNR
ncbi:MAG: spermidine/putrescine ABC transporter substrate-binding protein [Anaerolineales bacterium]